MLAKLSWDLWSSYFYNNNNVISYFYLELLQVKESESDPLIGVENGSGILADGVAPKAPVWNSNKDLHA